MHVSSVRISAGLCLASLDIPVLSAAPPLPQRVQRIFVCDVSGSMSGDLPLVRRHVSAGMGKVMQENDLATLIYFSGRGQFGVICEAVSMRTQADRDAVNEAIERKLRPIGLTGFKEPLQEVRRVINRLKSMNPDSAFSLVFMSDGHDNQWSVAEIMSAVEDIAPDLVSSTIVEYGWYANRPLLTRMSEALGGQYVFVENGQQFLPVLDAGMSGRVAGAMRREVVLPTTPLHGLIFCPSADGMMVWNPDAGNAIRVPADQKRVYFLTDTPVGDSTAMGDPRLLDAGLTEGLYAAAAALSQRMLSDDVIALLGALGDVRLITQFASCFGKQQYSAFRNDAIAAALNPVHRWESGYDADAVPPDDAYTVLALLSDLSTEGNMLHTRDENWSYSPIGRKTSFSGDRIDEDTRNTLADVVASAARTGDLNALKQAVEDAQAASVKEYRFTRTNEAGVPMTNLVMHESRPNISIQTKQDGFLELGADGKAYGLPERLPAFIFRNYAIIRDGILNVEILPVSLSSETYRVLEARGVVSGGWVDGKVYPVSVVGMPVINRQMVRSAITGARELFGLEWSLHKAKAAQKVFKYYEEQYAPRSRTAGLEGTYGAEAAEWLKTIGLTDGGFSPKRAVDEVSDVYIGRELKVSIKGASSLAKISDVEERLDSGKKLTAAMVPLAGFVTDVREFLSRNKDETTIRNYLQTMTKSWISEARRINAKLAEIKFAVVVGQVWFREFDSLDEGSLDMTDDNGDTYFATAQLRELEVKI